MKTLLICLLLLAAGTAPSGANLQPWHFVAVTDPVVKSRIREAAEAEEVSAEPPADDPVVAEWVGFPEHLAELVVERQRRCILKEAPEQRGGRESLESPQCRHPTAWGT